MTGQISLRQLDDGDLPELFEHQDDPEANQMAAFPARNRDAFMLHWREILARDDVIRRTILLGSKVAGYAVCFKKSERLLIGYWIGRSFWGQGIATQAVSLFAASIPTRPLHAFVAKHNVASIRVLEKCGFQVSGESRAAVSTGGEVVDELVYSLSESCGAAGDD